MTIKITKQLATVEDLAIGTGTVVQERNGVPLTLTKIDLITASMLASENAGEGAALVSIEGGPTVEVAVSNNKADIVNRVIRVTSIAAMEAYSAPVGYVFSLNAGGRSGTFDVIAGDFSAELAADTANGIYVGLNNDPTALTMVAKRRINGTINFDFFGAIDGVSGAATAAIQAAINFADATGLILSGNNKTYRLDSHLDLKDKYTLQDATLYLPRDIDLTGAPVFGGGPRAVYSQNTSLLNLRRVKFYSDKTSLTKSVSIAFLNSRDLLIDGCTFIDFGDNTYYAQGFIGFNCKGVKIINSVFSNCSGDGGALSDGCSQIIFKGNVCQDNGDWGFAFSNNCTSGIVSDNLFLSNVSTGTGADECSDFTFSGNVSIGNEHGIRVVRFGATTAQQKYISVTGNVCRANNYGITVEDSLEAAGVIVSSNVVVGSLNQGILISNSAGFVVNANYVLSSLSDAILIISYFGVAGAGTVSANTIDSCTHGIRELAAGGTIVGSFVAGNLIKSASIAEFSLPESAFIQEVGKNLAISGSLIIPTGVTSGTASTGGTALPTNAAGYMELFVDGTLKKVPYYNA